MHKALAYFGGDMDNYRFLIDGFNLVPDYVVGDYVGDGDSIDIIAGQGGC